MATRSAIYNECNGDAHENAYIDNCMICAPRWGHYFTCPDCTGKLGGTKRYAVGTCVNEDCLSYRQQFNQTIPEI